MTVKKTGIPPNGFAGFGQQSVAAQQMIGGAMAKKTRRKKRRKKRVTKKRATRRKTTRKKKPARLVKGSAAAKRHMAKLRAMRGKR